MPTADRRCDVDQLCVDDHIEVFESRVPDPGYTACLVCDPLGTGGGIVLAPGQEGGRRRFSICHELGHYHIPTHQIRRDHASSCGETEMRAGATDSAALEWEANDFAAELLMPLRQFASDIAKRDFSIATARELASDAFYDTSVTAAAWRMVQLAKYQCAMVVTSNGIIEWAARSESLRLPGLRRGSSVNGNSLAWAAAQGADGEARPLDVDVEAWFSPQYPVRGKLVESTHPIRITNQVISMLWLIDEDDNE
ncbi:MAG: ImmA/IrrE family metallo-endopeptidase [Gemmatimonadaceae bacterium]